MTANLHSESHSDILRKRREISHKERVQIMLSCGNKAVVLLPVRLVGKECFKVLTPTSILEVKFADLDHSKTDATTILSQTIELFPYVEYSVRNKELIFRYQVPGLSGYWSLLIANDKIQHRRLTAAELNEFI